LAHAGVRQIKPNVLQFNNENIMAFGLPGRGKPHFLAALGRELILRHMHGLAFDFVWPEGEEVGEDQRGVAPIPTFVEQLAYAAAFVNNGSLRGGS